MTELWRSSTLWLFRTNRMESGNQREVAVMLINHTDMDVRYDNYRTRTAKVNRDGWILGASVDTGGGRISRIPSVVRLLRWSFGTVLISAGARLQGRPADQIGDPIAAV